MKSKEGLSLTRIVIVSWITLVSLTLSSWLAFSVDFALAVIYGSLIANISFLLLRRDLTRLLQGELTAVKARFLTGYYIRLTAIAVIMLVLIKYRAVNVVGLLVGLSTIFISIGLVAIFNAVKEFNIREA